MPCRGGAESSDASFRFSTRAATAVALQVLVGKEVRVWQRKQSSKLFLADGRGQMALRLKLVSLAPDFVPVLAASARSSGMSA